MAETGELPLGSVIALGFRVWKCHVDFQALEGYLIARSVETDE
jgi:hypothetical protein